MLNESLISHHLTHAGFHQPFQMHLFSSIDSTNQFLIDLPKSHHIDICSAETQTKGRGRFNRPWVSPDAENLYFSSRWYLTASLASLSAISLLVSIAIMHALESFGISHQISIKWPNDLLWNHKKICGILLESTQDSQGTLALVIGIGLNVHLNPKDTRWHELIHQPWSSLYEITGFHLNREALLAELIVQLHRHINVFITQGFQPFEADWQRWDYLQGKSIQLRTASKIYHGIAQGITTNGQLILLDEDMKQHYFSSGEASILS